MSPSLRPDHDADDYFSESRMSFGDHIEELRTYLLRALYGFGIGMVLSFFVGSYVLEMISKPVVDQLGVFHDRHTEAIREKLKNDPDLTKKLQEPKEIEALISVAVLKKRLNVVIPEDAEGVSKDGKFVALPLWLNPLEVSDTVVEALSKLGPKPTLRTLRVEEALMVYFKVCLATGFVIGSPWIFFQLWSFIAAGLYPHEKRYVNVYLPFSVVLFLAGAAMCQFLVIPRAVESLLWFNEWLGFEPELRLNDWLSFAIFMPLVFGLLFQTPLVMIFLEKMGIVRVEVFAKHRRMVWFVLFVAAVLISPSADLFSCNLLGVAVVLLYELGILICKLSPRNTSPFDEEDVSEPDGLIEV